MADEAALASAEVILEDMELAASKLKEGKDLIDDNPEKAVELLCAAVRAYEKRFGSEALECADVYLYYGIALYEVARNVTDALGLTKTAVEPRDNALLAGDTDGTAEGVNGSDKAGSAAAGDTMETNNGEEKGDGAAVTDDKRKDGDAVKAVDTKVADDHGQGGDSIKAADVEVEDATKDVDADKAADDAGDDAAKNDDADKASDAEKSGDGEEDEEDKDGGGAGGEEGGDGFTNDDMKLAWEMIELARIIYCKHQPEQHHSKLAEVQKSLGDINSEQERFNEAADCYRQSIEHLQAMQPPSKRRVAEVQYKLSLVLTFLDLPGEAMKLTQEALVSLAAAVVETEEKLGALPTDGSGGEAAELEGRRLQETSDDLRGIITELTSNVEGLQDTIDNDNSFKESMKQLFIKAAEGTADPGSATGALQVLLSTKFAAPSNPVSTSKPVSLGVVGRGTKRITLQPSAAANTQAQPGGGAPAPTKRTLEDLMGGMPAETTACGFAVVETRDEGQQPPKKARVEETVAEPAGAPQGADAEVVTGGN